MQTHTTLTADWCPPDDHTVQEVGQPAIAGDVGEVREAPLASQEKGSEHSCPGSASTPESGSQEWGMSMATDCSQPPRPHGGNKLPEPITQPEGLPGDHWAAP